MASISIDGMNWDQRTRTLFEGLGALGPRRAIVVRRAQKRAATKAARYARRQLARVAASAIGVPQSTFITHRIRIRITEKELWEATVWVGEDPFPAHRLGTVRWNRRMTGARAGRRTFPGSFAHRAPEGPIFIRTGESPRIMTRGSHGGEVREPIDRLDIPFQEVVRANVPRISRETQRRYQRIMAQELNFELQKLLGKTDR
ncbi:phage tail protein [Thiohalobacter thiocyanaticus]|uniref:Phage tail protein n=1 Tax=Thiohalobacter thiocyanaticus TaxID=585455 RepID=A0A426QG17_9GAMM|nr:phage tail protein [Thiohalobacter thiocyanaticus]RRQ20695.1 hypothetical protein D6C00_00980 [Thiohalobacter thiocyanaticus]